MERKWKTATAASLVTSPLGENPNDIQCRELTGL